MLFDRTELLDNFDGDEELADSILGDAITEIPKAVEKLRTACSSGDIQAIRIESHTMKGMGANLCTHELRDISAEIETAAKSGDLATAQKMLPELEKTVLMTLEAISG